MKRVKTGWVQVNLLRDNCRISCPSCRFLPYHQLIKPGGCWTSFFYLIWEISHLSRPWPACWKRSIFYSIFKDGIHQNSTADKSKEIMKSPDGTVLAGTFKRPAVCTDPFGIQLADYHDRSTMTRWQIEIESVGWSGRQKEEKEATWLLLPVDVTYHWAICGRHVDRAGHIKPKSNQPTLCNEKKRIDKTRKSNKNKEKRQKQLATADLLEAACSAYQQHQSFVVGHRPTTDPSPFPAFEKPSK